MREIHPQREIRRLRTGILVFAGIALLKPGVPG